MKNCKFIDNKIIDAQKMGLFDNDNFYKNQCLDKYGNYCFLNGSNNSSDSTLNDVSNNLNYIKNKTE